MKHLLVLVAVLWCPVALVGCDDAADPSGDVGQAAAAVVKAHADWTTNFDEAKQTAAAEDKSVFLLFTGTEWCVPCKVMEQTVLSTDAFKSWADEHVVPVLLDFPAQAADGSGTGPHAELYRQYEVNGFPTIVMTDPAGLPFSTVVFSDPSRLFRDMKEGYARRASRDAAFAKADQAEGLEKAKALDEGLTALGMPAALKFYPERVDTLIAADPDNAIGLKQRYQQARADERVNGLVQEAYAMLEKQDLDGAFDLIDNALALEPSTGLCQALTAFKGQIRLQQGQRDEARQLLNEAIEIAPDSEVVPQIEHLIKQAVGG